MVLSPCAEPTPYRIGYLTITTVPSSIVFNLRECGLAGALGVKGGRTRHNVLQDPTRMNLQVESDEENVPWETSYMNWSCFQ